MQRTRNFYDKKCSYRNCKKEFKGRKNQKYCCLSHKRCENAYVNKK